MNLDLLSELRSLGRVLLDPSASPGLLKQACEQLHARCIGEHSGLSAQATALSSGKALSPADAAICVLDFERTAKFMRAVDLAIAQRQNRHRPVHVLYAGCGPLAALALPAALRRSANKVVFSLVDVHPDALAYARRLFEQLGIAHQVRDWICADASSLRLPAESSIDVLVVETMQRALEHEPQLAVTCNLLPQCAPDAALVPASISVSAWLARAESELGFGAQPDRIELAELIALSRDHVDTLIQDSALGAKTLPERRIHLPKTTLTGYSLMLRTRIEVAQGIELRDYDSGLTYPKFLFDLDPLQPGGPLAFAYRLGGAPGFQVIR